MFRILSCEIRKRLRKQQTMKTFLNTGCSGRQSSRAADFVIRNKPGNSGVLFQYFEVPEMQ